MCVTDKMIEQTIFELLRRRDACASICPSEVARALAEDEPAWRALMPAIRQAAATLSAEGSLRITRKAQQVDAMRPGGPIRLRLP